MPLPPESVSRNFGRLVQPLFARIRSNTEESRTLAQLRDILLPKLLSGDLRVAAAEELMEYSE
jgi:type I restriction enzyme, S subunit